MAGNITITKSDLDWKRVWSFLVDIVVAILVISVFNLLIVTVFGLSPRGLLEKGIETNLYERKMELYDYLSLGYIALIVLYLSALRKYYSLGNELFKINK
jgi:hypothetical protein